MTDAPGYGEDEAVSSEGGTARVNPTGGYLAFDEDNADGTRPVDLASFEPADPARFALRVDIWSDQDGFSVFVCSPLWLTEHFRPGPPSPWPLAGPTPRPHGFPPMWTESGAVMFGRGMLFLPEWSFTEFESAVQEVFAEARGVTKVDAALDIDRVFPWEFAGRAGRSH